MLIYEPEGYNDIFVELKMLGQSRAKFNLGLNVIHTMEYPSAIFLKKKT